MSVSAIPASHGPVGAMRRGRRVALVACYPLRDAAMPQQFISNHGMRMVEAALRSAGIEDLDLRVWDLTHTSVDSLVEELLDFDPDLVGFSSYLWSFPFFVEVARQVKFDDPRRCIVFGGPSARPSMLSLEPFEGARQWIDALAINEGEDTFVAIAQLGDRSRDSLAQLTGLALPTNTGWEETPPRPLSALNDLASPYQMGLVPRGGVGVLQTYRGCPFTCSFCEWGTLESPKRAWEVESLCKEFEALSANGVGGTLLVDAGLNLNEHAFRNLREASDITGFYDDRYIICEVYPAKVNDDHIGFLESISKPLVGMGLQSFDHEVLDHVERSYDESRFERTLEEIGSVASVALEIILGLPGDSPENFRRSFERARSLPCALRVYHCCVLPSALMVRAPDEYALDYDPVTLKMRSCLGWSREDLQREVDFVTREAELDRGETGQYFWIFSAPRHTVREPIHGGFEMTASVDTTEPEGFFRLLEIDAADAAEHADAFEQLRRTDVHGIMVHNVLPAEDLAHVSERLARHDPPFLKTSFPDEFYSWFYGRNLNLAHPDLVGYFEEAEEFRGQLADLFIEERGIETYVADLMQQLDGGRPFEAPPGLFPPQQYMFTTLRCHEQGGHIPAHLDNEFALRRSYRHLRELVEAPILSFVLAIAEAAAGGELKIFDFRQDTAGNFETSGPVEIDTEGLESVSFRIPAGSMIVIDSGRYLHEVTPVIGEQPRWTVCSFMALSREHDKMYCWG